MKKIVNGKIFIVSVSFILLVACASKPSVSDFDLQQNVRIALDSASDLPQQLQVEVDSGVVRVIGSLECEECGGNATPGQLDTIQQSLGAIIRAVPGVTLVEFYLNPV